MDFAGVDGIDDFFASITIKLQFVSWLIQITYYARSVFILKIGHCQNEKYEQIARHRQIALALNKQINWRLLKTKSTKLTITNITIITKKNKEIIIGISRWKRYDNR